MTSTYTLAPSDSTNYEEGYKIFLQRSDFRERIVEQFASLVRTELQNSTRLSVLDFGCGNGQMTGRYIEQLKNKAKDIDLCLVEPAVHSLQNAIETLKSTALVTCKESQPKDEKFDFIIASYVFYHLSSECLFELASALNPGGVLAIMMGTSENPFKSHPGLKKDSTHGSSDKLNPFLNSLETRGNYTIERYRVNTHLDLNGLQNVGSLTDEGKSLLGFSLNQNYSSLSSEAFQAIDEIYKEAFQKNAGRVTSVHEIIWIKRLK